jgi:nitrite reductase/ring-hydroxylating ferredoxin subunit
MDHAADHADRIRAADLPPGTVRRVGTWAVGNRDGELFAVSRRCRHQLGDLAKGTIDADGCLVCPWHQSRYDVGTGEMVAGPRGFLGYHGPTPGYTQLVLSYGRVLRLRIGRALRRGGDVVVEDEPASE